MFEGHFSYTSLATNPLFGLCAAGWPSGLECRFSYPTNDPKGSACSVEIFRCTTDNMSILELESGNYYDEFGDVEDEVSEYCQVTPE